MELTFEKLLKAIEHYLQYAEEQNWSRGTIKDRRNILKLLLRFLEGKPYTLDTLLSFRTYLYKTWKTPETRSTLTKKLRAFTNWLAKFEYLEKSFAERIDKPKVPTRPTFDYFEPSLIDEVIDLGTEPSPIGVKGDNSRNRYVKNEMRQGMYVLIRTGIRVSELQKLKGTDLNLYEETPSMWIHSKGTKGGDRDLLPIPADMLEEFKARKNRERVFEVNQKTLNLALKRGFEKLGIKTDDTIHDLRHIFATSLTKRGVPIQTISRLLRHDSILTTVRYYQHLNVRDLSFTVNNQPIVRNGIEIPERIAMLEQAVKETGIEKDERLLVSWTKLSNGGFTLHVVPKETLTTEKE